MSKAAPYSMLRFAGTPEEVSEQWHASRRRGLGGSQKIHLGLGGIVSLGFGPAGTRALGLLCSSGVHRVGAGLGGLLGLGLSLGSSGGLHLGLGAAATTLGLLCRLGRRRGGLLRHGDSRRLDTRCGGLF